MGVKEQMIAILRDRDTARIRFNYSSGGRTASINQDVFTRVADDLASGHLHVVEGRYTENRVVYSSWREGSNAANTFYLGENPRWSRDFNALVVHESIHAYFDVTRTEMPWLHNETIAYIVQGFYLRNSGYPHARMEEDEPYEVGWQAAVEMARGGSGSQWIQSLQDLLNSDPRYSSYITQSYTGDG
jgi:hypothetical protein